MREVQLYINNKRVDLFKDEKIQITSSIQNIQDISKVFTDFSQSFTVPCSHNNNSIFDYFYNNDVDGSFKAKERADARIEINNVPFRKGKVQLEGAEVKNNKADSYKVTFYGDVVTLKDLFGEFKLQDLDYSNIAFDYTEANVINTITSSTDMPVRFPLISSERVWEYGTGFEDISTLGGAIDYGELYPAIKDKEILNAIESLIGVTFNSNFIDSDYFQKSFTYWKNSKEGAFTSEAVDLEFNDTSGTPPYTMLENSVATIEYIDPNLFLTSGYDIITDGAQQLTVYISTSPSNSYLLDVYKNGALQTTLTGSGGGAHAITLDINTPSLSDEYTFKARLTGGTGSISGSVRNIFQFTEKDPVATFSNVNVTVWETPITSVFVNSNLDFNITAPDMKISDWFSGILKEFNLTCYPLDEDKTYQIEPLEQWYNYGGELDITPYTEIKSIKIDRPKLYKRISFEWAKTKAFLNEAFEGFYGRMYGTLEEEFPYDGKEFKVKLPFENMLFNKFTGTDLQVSYCLDDGVDGKSYIPKPVKLFIDSSKVCSFYIGTTEITNYIPFGQDQYTNLTDYSQNFGLDISTLKDYAVQDSLYKTWYSKYIENLFNDKTREVTVKCHLPLDKLTNLTLDDSIILRDKKYIINKMKTELTGGQVELELLSDWTTRTAQPVYPTKPYSGDGGTITVGVKPIKPENPTKRFNGGGGSVVLEAPSEPQFVITTPTFPATFTGEDTIEIEIPVNNTGATRTQIIPVKYYDVQNNVMQTSQIVITQLNNDSYLLKEDGSYLLLEDLGKIIL